MTFCNYFSSLSLSLITLVLQSFIKCKFLSIYNCKAVDAVLEARRKKDHIALTLHLHLFIFVQSDLQVRPVQASSWWLKVSLKWLKIALWLTRDLNSQPKSPVKYLASVKRRGKDVPVLFCSLPAAPRSSWAVPESLGWSWPRPTPSFPSLWTWPPMCTSSQTDHRSPGKRVCTTSLYLHSKRNR